MNGRGFPPGPVGHFMSKSHNGTRKSIRELAAENSTEMLPFFRAPSMHTNNYLATNGASSTPNAATWNAVMKKLVLDPSDEYDLVNLSNIRFARNVARKLTNNFKLPFLVAELTEDLNYNGINKSLRHKNPSVSLRDSTGQLLATFSREVIENYGESLVQGATLAVSNCGLSCIGNARDVIITIPKSSLLCIATSVQVDHDEVEFDAENQVYIMQANVPDKDGILNEYFKLSDQLAI